jgi:outer membrane lipoprotein SlyB
MRKWIAVLAVVSTLSLAGCSHYRVTSSDTGEVYYTNDCCKVRKARNPEKTISFKEKITGETVTLQSPSVEKIGRSEYKAEVSTIKAEAGM